MINQDPNMSRQLDTLSRRIVDMENRVGDNKKLVALLPDNATNIEIIHKINELIASLNLKLR
jgi:uncharacterized protein YeeX (DUF496 family)